MYAKNPEFTFDNCNTSAVYRCHGNDVIVLAMRLANEISPSRDFSGVFHVTIYNIGISKLIASDKNKYFLVSSGTFVIV